MANDQPHMHEGAIQKGGEILSNTANALTLLKEWLSVSESQICSTEVLSEQLPRVNSLLVDSMNELSQRFAIVAENSTKIDEHLHNLQEMQNRLTINKESESIDIAQYIKTLAPEIKNDITRKKFEDLAQAASEQHSDMSQVLDQANQVMQDTSDSISQIIISMQFQDRVSQNIIITINIMKTIVDYLEKGLNISLPNVSKDERKKLLDKDFAVKLLEEFRLGELQHSFVNHLLEHGYISSATDIGFEDSQASIAAEDDEDDIELF